MTTEAYRLVQALDPKKAMLTAIRRRLARQRGVTPQFIADGIRGPLGRLFIDTLVHELQLNMLDDRLFLRAIPFAFLRKTKVAWCRSPEEWLLEGLVDDYLASLGWVGRKRPNGFVPKTQIRPFLEILVRWSFQRDHAKRQERLKQKGVAA